MIDYDEIARELLPCRCILPRPGVIGLAFCEPCNLRPVVAAKLREVADDAEAAACAEARRVDELFAKNARLQGELAESIALNMGLEQNQDDLFRELTQLRAALERARGLEAAVRELVQVPAVVQMLGTAATHRGKCSCALCRIDAALAEPEP